MKKAQEGPFGERIETDPTVRGIKVRTQRTLADSMHVECPEPSPDGRVGREKGEEDTMLINPDVNSMDSRG